MTGPRPREQTKASGGRSMAKDFVVHLRGLPWSSDSDAVINFFPGVRIRGGKSGVHLTTAPNGRPSGEAFVQLETHHDQQLALLRNNDTMGKRFIEVRSASATEMARKVEPHGEVSAREELVRVRGLPYGCTAEEISCFFEDLPIATNGILLSVNSSGITSGESFVCFQSPAVAKRALGRHKAKLHERYIEVFPASRSEENRFVKEHPGHSGVYRPQFTGAGSLSGYAGPVTNGEIPAGVQRVSGQAAKVAEMSSTPFSVLLKNLPVDTTDSAILHFLRPFKPVKVAIQGDLSSGQAFAVASFMNPTLAQQATTKSGQQLDGQPVEVILSSDLLRNPPPPAGERVPVKSATTKTKESSAAAPASSSGATTTGKFSYAAMAAKSNSKSAQEAHRQGGGAGSLPAGVLRVPSNGLSATAMSKTAVPQQQQPQAQGWSSVPPALRVGGVSSGGASAWNKTPSASSHSVDGALTNGWSQTQQQPVRSVPRHDDFSRHSAAGQDFQPTSSEAYESRRRGESAAFHPSVNNDDFPHVLVEQQNGGMEFVPPGVMRAPRFAGPPGAISAAHGAPPGLVHPSAALSDFSQMHISAPRPGQDVFAQKTTMVQKAEDVEAKSAAMVKLLRQLKTENCRKTADRLFAKFGDEEDFKLLAHNIVQQAVDNIEATVQLCQDISQLAVRGRFSRILASLLKMEFAGAVDSVNFDDDHTIALGVTETKSAQQLRRLCRLTDCLVEHEVLDVDIVTCCLLKLLGEKQPTDTCLQHMYTLLFSWGKQIEEKDATGFQKVMIHVRLLAKSRAVPAHIRTQMQYLCSLPKLNWNPGFA